MKAILSEINLSKHWISLFPPLGKNISQVHLLYWENGRKFEDNAMVLNGPGYKKN